MANVGIIYWSGTGNTEKMSELIEQGAKEAGAAVTRKNVASASLDELSRYDVVVFGSPSMGAEVVEESEMEPFVTSALPGLKDKKAAIFGSYGWGDGEWMRNWSAQLKSSGVNLLDDGLIVNETPDGDKAALCLEYGKKIAAF
ncbi:MAG: flavodoxin [Synergistaceae bacterium]|jgi:flavodoxin short chain|nr:flavodoxin [Synergistaceae bacterium]